MKFFLVRGVCPVQAVTHNYVHALIPKHTKKTIPVFIPKYFFTFSQQFIAMANKDSKNAGYSGFWEGFYCPIGTAKNKPAIYFRLRFPLYIEPLGDDRMMLREQQTCSALPIGLKNDAAISSRQ